MVEHSDPSIVCLSTIDWDFLWQGHQEIMARFASKGRRVVFIENMGGIRTVRWSDAGRIAARLRRVISRTQPRGAQSTAQLRVISPLLLPFPRARWARPINGFLLRRLARRVHALAGADPVIFTFLPSAEARRLIADVRGPYSVVVYYCVADFAELAEDHFAVVENEAALVRSADLVFVNSRRFAERFADLNTRVSYFPGGVNLEEFDPGTATAVPEDLASLHKPRIGYAGGLHKHLDLALLKQLARALPDASIVLIGPVLTDLEDLPNEPNVHLLGPRPWRSLPAYVRGFDVGVIPYVRSAYTETVYPTKLFEYLAMGKPVVTTTLPEVIALALPDSSVRIASDRDAFVTAVKTALTTDDEGARSERRELARGHDWSAIVARMEDLIREGLEAKRRT